MPATGEFIPTVLGQNIDICIEPIPSPTSSLSEFTRTSLPLDLVAKSGIPKDISVSFLEPNLWLNQIPSISSTAVFQKPAISGPIYPANAKQRCSEAYFHFFNAAHPFLLPRDQLLQLLAKRAIPHLAAAMCYIGSFFIPDISTMRLAQEVERLISLPSTVKDGFTVQAMLLLVIGLDGSKEYKKAGEMLDQAQNLALKLGMNLRDFATIHRDDCPFLEESWRRTWWELYFVDGAIAAKMEIGSFRLYDVAADVCLPCEEDEYASGVSFHFETESTSFTKKQQFIPPPRTVEDFDNAFFIGDNAPFSSYAYRIAAIRNLGRVLKTPTPLVADETVTANIDAYLVNWERQIPASKSLSVDMNGRIDELLFQAHVTTNA
jgi:hypothetical protein